MAESPKNDINLQYQQLQLDNGVLVAELNMLKTEMNQTKLQLEVSRRASRDSSIEERTLALKAEFEKDLMTKDQEIKIMTEKMTQAYLDTASVQQEKADLLQEKAELLQEKSNLEKQLQELENQIKEGGVIPRTPGLDTESGSESEEESESASASASAPAALATEEQLAQIESLKKDLQVAQEKIEALELKLADFTDRAIDDEDKLRAIEDEMSMTRIQHAEQVALLEHDRDELQRRLEDSDLVLKVATDSLQSKLENAQREAGQADEQLLEVQARLNHEAEQRRLKEAESDAKIKTIETELHESQILLTKNEKQIKELQTSITKREQEISSLKSELEELAGMAQNDEVDRMRKIWENEKKRLEDAVAEDQDFIASLRADVAALEDYETECRGLITELETTVANLTSTNSDLQSEVTRLKQESTTALEKFDLERSELQAKVAESEKAIEAHVAEAKSKMEGIEQVTQSVDMWKDRCEALQLEMVQKTAKAEDTSLELAEIQAERDALQLESEATLQDLQAAQDENTLLVSKVAELEAELAKDEKTLLIAKVAELEAALAQDEKASLVAKVAELEAALALASEAAKVPAAPVVVTPPEPDSKLEEEIAQLKQTVEDLTRENVVVANENKKLMLEHDNLMEAHKHVETECLKLMDEVERLHSESLAAAEAGAQATGKDDADLMENAEPKAATDGGDSQASNAQSQSVIRLEGLLKEKQALLDRLTQAHASEMRELRKRYVELDRSKVEEVAVLNKELTDLESLIESKIFREADLEEEVQRKQKQIERMELELADSKKGGSNGSAYLSPGVHHQSSLRTVTPPPPPQRVHVPMDVPPTVQVSEDGIPLFCEICEVEGHDIISCTATFGSSGSKAPSHNSTPAPSEVQEDRPYCENCDVFDDHYTDECPNESLTY
ncbi:hypothetical protein BGX31_001946 [Mortierella sp. GBA43]|nr:hypothetical protein BGX31_001946 [Mortierella sp. GBA43]